MLATLIVALAAATAATPPQTAVRPVTDTLHGVSIVDDYRWLEALEKDSPEVAEWTSAQIDRTKSILGNLPCHSRLEQELEPLMSIGSIGMPKRGGGLAFWTQRDGKQNQPILYVGADPAAAGAASGSAPAGPSRTTMRVLLDLNALDAKGLTSLDWWQPSYDGKAIAFGTSKSGSEMSVLSLLDVATGTWLPDEISGKVSFDGWSPDGRAFIYTKLADPKDPYSREIRWHVVGTHPRHDPLIDRQTDPSVIPGAALSRDGRWIFVIKSRGWQACDLYAGDMERWLRMGAAPGALTLAPIAVGLDGNSYPVATVGDTMYMQSTVEAPKGKICAVDLHSPDRANWKTIIAERQDRVLEGSTWADGILVASYAKDVVTRIERFTPDGKSLGEITLPGLGTATVSADETRRDGFFSYTSYNEPRSIYTVDFATGASALWARPEVPIDPSTVEVKQVFVASKDGTKVPMFVIHKKGLKPNGATPTILYGYGGFNVALTPAFDPTNWPWFEAGGIYAIANLRGGSEYGEEWHRAGMLGNKQNVFNDFYACAEWLISQRLTDSAHLAIEGGSNGGLLTGVAVTQRPDLFCAAISAVPLLDMLRYQDFLLAKYWVPEYGSSADPEQFKWLSAYSPYQHVVKGKQYPSVLFTAGENDSRVHPLHARKMAARMQALASNDDATHPILLWIDRDAGHGQGKPLANRIAEQADQLSYFMWQTGLCK